MSISETLLASHPLIFGANFNKSCSIGYEQIDLGASAKLEELPL
jgi:hypothetical protein